MNKYITSQGDTWDLIAFRNYGLTRREFMMSDLISANEKFVNVVIFSANCELDIPEAVIPDTMNLPPWLR